MGKKESSGDEWLTTYADAITLLMAFFVLFFSITDGADTVKLLEIMNTLKGATGTMEYDAVTTPFPSPTQVLKDREQSLDNMQEMIKSEGLDGQMGIDMNEDGYKITLSNSLAFDTGTNNLTRQGQDVVRRIALSFQDGVKSIQVVGHTDGQPVRSARYPSNLHLGAARSISVMQEMIANSAVNPASFEATSKGQYEPIATNSTPQGRAENRRVEIYIKFNIPNKIGFDDFSNINFNQ